MKDKKESKNKVILAGGIILFMGTIFSLLFLVILMLRPKEYITLLMPAFLAAIIYTPLGYLSLYKQNRWTIFSSLILIFLSLINSLLSENSGVAIIFALIIIPIYKGAEAAFKIQSELQK